MTTRGRAATAAATASLAGIALFAAATIAEHVADSRLSPARHTISEYANGAAGAVMDVGFAGWAVALLACAALVSLAPAARTQRPLGIFIAVLLAIAAAGVVTLDAFPTQTVAGALPPGQRWTTAGRLHDAGSGTATAALACAALASLWLSATGRRYRLSVVALLVACICGSIVGLAIGPAVGGLRQRLLVTAAVVWQVLFTEALRRSESMPGALQQPESRAATGPSEG